MGFSGWLSHPPMPPAAESAMDLDGRAPDSSLVEGGRSPGSLGGRCRYSFPNRPSPIRARTTPITCEPINRAPVSTNPS